MGPVMVYLGLGSNLGDREANLRHALELLSEDITLERVSSIYDTDPWGYEDQPRFLNCVCGGGTSLSPRELLVMVKGVERAIGREPSFHNGPRTIDVDILLYGQQRVIEAGLEIPHPRLVERAFVLVPLAEIAGDHNHPVLGLTVNELLQSMGTGEQSTGIQTGGVRWWAPPISIQGLS
jgi:2-amino-4-hydroxy-6-hydroxymethyldihydropteridine diphosphokinase